MKFAKKYGIMVDVNKKFWISKGILRHLYNMHKNNAGILWKPKKWKEK